MRVVVVDLPDVALAAEMGPRDGHGLVLLVCGMEDRYWLLFFQRL